MRDDRNTARTATAAARPAPRRRGTAMVEFVFCIPVLALILGLTFFFGWVYQNQEHVRMAAHYAAWRRVHNDESGADCNNHIWHRYAEPDPNDGPDRDAFRDNYERINTVEVTEELINQEFFSGIATNVGVGYGSGPDDTIRDLITAAGGVSPDAGALADQAITDHFPHGARASVSAEFPTSVALWQRFTGALSARTVRDGTQWRRWQVEYLEPIRDLFLLELDQAVETIPMADLRENIRALYLRAWNDVIIHPDAN